MAAPHIAYISVGSNLGDKKQNCQKGISFLGDTPGTTVLDQSLFYETEPVDYRDQDWFVNGAIKIQTELSPHALLATLKEIEKKLGRDFKTIRFGPRVIDMDIILYDGLTLVTPELEIPHPRMHQRRFVLRPICDIDPNLRHPSLHQTMIELYDAIDGQDQGMKTMALE